MLQAGAETFLSEDELAHLLQLLYLICKQALFPVHFTGTAGMLWFSPFFTDLSH